MKRFMAHITIDLGLEAQSLGDAQQALEAIDWHVNLLVGDKARIVSRELYEAEVDPAGKEII